MGLLYSDVSEFFGEWDVEVGGEVARVSISDGQAVVRLFGEIIFSAKWQVSGDRMALEGVDRHGVDFRVELHGARPGAHSVDLVRYVQGGVVRREGDGATLAIVGGPTKVDLMWRGEQARARRARGAIHRSEDDLPIGDAAALSRAIGDRKQLAVPSARMERLLSSAVGAIEPQAVLTQGAFQHPRAGEIGVIVLDETPPTQFTQAWSAARHALNGSGAWPIVVGEDWDRGFAYAPPREVIINEASRLDPSAILRLDRERAGDGDEEFLGLISGTVSMRGEALLSVDAHSRTLVGRRGAPDSASVGTQYLVMVPGSSGAQALATIGWSDGNTLGSGQHVAVLGHFERTYGAELAAIDGSGIDLMLGRPLADPVTATRVALERLAYGDTTGNGTAFFVAGDELSVARAAMRDQVWSFWWD